MVLSAPSPQTVQTLDESRGGERGTGVVVECQVSEGTQLIEWWKDNLQLALLNLTYDSGSGAGIGDDYQVNIQSSQQGI